MKLAITVAAAIAALTVAPEVARAATMDGAGTAFLQCRREAVGDYAACLEGSDSWRGDYACYWAAAADLVSCDTRFLRQLVI